MENGKGLAAITIDALEEADCANTFAYIPDWMNNALLVFSARDRKIWRFNHNYFSFNPFEGKDKYISIDLEIIADFPIR